MKLDYGRVLKEWLIEEDRFIREIPKADVEGGPVTFAYLYNSGGMHQWVVQPQGQDKVILRTVLDVSPEHRRLLYDQMSQRDRAEFLWELRFGLLWKETAFQMIPNGEKLERFEFTYTLHEDGLSKSKFEAAIRDIHLASLFVVWSLRRAQEMQTLSQT